MKTISTKNPFTGRPVCARVWDIDPRAAITSIKAGSGARELSWSMLDEDESLLILEEEDGDDAENNFALAIFEQALDFRLGLAAINFIDMCVRHHGKRPKPFKVACSRSGDVWIIGASGSPYMTEAPERRRGGRR